MRRAPVPELISYLEDLAVSPDNHTREILQYLHHVDPPVREAAVWALWNGDLMAIADPLVDRIENDPDALVQSAAVSVLARFVYENLMLDEETAKSTTVDTIHEMNRYLRVLLESPDRPSHIRRRALESLSFNADKRVETRILEWLKSEDALSRKSAAFALGRANIPQLSKYLLEALDDPSARVRVEAIRSIGEQGVKKAVPSLAAIAEEASDESALEAIHALGQVGGKRAEKVLQKLAGQPFDRRARAAVEALEELCGND